MSKEKIVILGGGESGTGAALLAKAKGYDVFLSDLGEIKAKYREKLDQENIVYESGKHTEDKILDANFVIKSPGIPQKAPLIQKIKGKGIPVISEIEFASWFTNKPIIAITGSNGKTTTTSIIAHMFQKERHKIGLGGNIGKSFAELVIRDDVEFYILEISSFQLDNIQKFKPHIAILLNITPDHLDQYDYDMDKYADSKFRITENQDEEDFFIYNADDKKTLEILDNKQIKAKKLAFSLKDSKQAGFANKIDFIIKEPETFRMKVEDLALMGEHNVSNSLAGAISGSILKIRKKTIQDSLTDFDAIEHRMEPVLKIQNIEFINDSKATNVNSVVYALQSMQKPTVWIVGGQDKGNDYTELIPLVRKKVKAIVCLGLDNNKIIDTFKNVVDVIVETKNMKDAVNTAYTLGKPGDTVLLSPACSSFDLFENYEQRGKLFKEEVKKL